MPLGYQQRFKYGKVARSEGSTGTIPWNVSGRPLIGYDAVFTYRSGRKSKLLSEQGNVYSSLVAYGSLSDQMRRRNEFLQMQIRDELSPSSGGPTAFSCTGDTGHPFATYKVSATQPYARSYFKQGALWTNSDIVFSAVVPMPDLADPLGLAFTNRHVVQRRTYFTWPTSFVYPPASSPSLVVSSAVKNAVGAGVIASANPWKPKATLAQTILELMSGDVPSVVKNLRKYVTSLQSLKKTAGSDWLNVQFGWVPLINDIRDTVETLLKLHMLLYGSDNYRRTRGGDLGEWSRFQQNTSDRTLDFGSPLAAGALQSPYWKDYQNTGYPLVGPGYVTGDIGNWSRSVRITADFRFSAKYHRGAQPNSRERGYIERATELLGLEITPAVLWEITPWTWLLDWASNLGSVAANISQLDWSNVLLDYAYLTFFVKTESSIAYKGPTQITPELRLSHGYIAQGYTTEEKVREQASPYGFSVSWDGLNPFQLSILAALGMSRGR
jgi:hypothetical protein